MASVKSVAWPGSRSTQHQMNRRHWVSWMTLQCFMLFEYVQYKDIGNLLKSLRHTKFWVYKEIAYLFLIGPSKYLYSLTWGLPMATWLCTCWPAASSLWRHSAVVPGRRSLKGVETEASPIVVQLACSFFSQCVTKPSSTVSIFGDSTTYEWHTSPAPNVSTTHWKVLGALSKSVPRWGSCPILGPWVRTA